MQKQKIGMARCEHVGGPLDGSHEIRSVAPREGEPVFRLIGNVYHKYVWEKGRFVYYCPAAKSKA